MGGLDATGSEVFLHSEGPSTRLLFVDAKSCAIYSERVRDGRPPWLEDEAEEMEAWLKDCGGLLLGLFF